jgi:branched-chain amino acid transport system permease protein
MKTTGNYRQGIERFLPSPSEGLLLGVLVLFTAKLYPATGNVVMLGLSSMAIVIIAWVLGVALRAATNDMRWWLLLGGLLTLLVPFLGQNTFQVQLMAEVCVFALLIYGLNVVTGYTGQISLGHGALVGISAYTVAILVHHFDWPIVPSMLVAVVITTVFGFALGIPALRLAGPYLAIATLAAAIIFPLVLKLDSVDEYTGGGQGISERNITPPGAINTFLKDRAPDETFASDSQKAKFAQGAYLYYIALVTAVVGLFTVWNIGRSRFGRAFIAVRDGEVAATSMGINVALYKVTAFGISAIYAGVSGAMLFLVVAFVAPESFDLLSLSINPVAYMVIGGLATSGGGVVGAIGLVWVPQIILKVAEISGEFDRLQGAMTGLLLVVVMTRLPQGVWGSVLRINQFSWLSLSTELGEWVKARPPRFWVSLVVGVIAIIVIGQLAGAVWAVFATGLALVAPTDAWGSLTGLVRKPYFAIRGRPDIDTHESAAVDAT